MTLWAITSYFNPGGCPYRYANYQRFRRALGIPLLTVELFFGTAHELNRADADIMLQIQGRPRNLLWQKERLLNLAVRKLPAEATTVCWLDCDVLFPDHSWPERAKQLLEAHPIIQLFASVHHLPAEMADADAASVRASSEHGTLYWQPSAMRNHLSEVPVQFQKFGSEGIGSRGNPGLAWAARKDLLLAHEIYDGAIGPQADSLFFSAVSGSFKISSRLFSAGSRAEQHWREWGQAIRASLQGDASFLDQPIYHLWHGEGKNRRYRQQIEILRLHGFDPMTDIAVDSNGCWRWQGFKLELEKAAAQHLLGSLRGDDARSNQKS